jgi:hypothetical protein
VLKELMLILLGATIPDILGISHLVFVQSPHKPWLVNPSKAWGGGVVDGGMKAILIQ